MAAFEKENINQLIVNSEQMWAWLQANVPGGILDGWDYVDLDLSWFFVPHPNDSSKLVVRKKAEPA